MKELKADWEFFNPELDAVEFNETKGELESIHQAFSKGGSDTKIKLRKQITQCLKLSSMKMISESKKNSYIKELQHIAEATVYRC